MMRLMGRQRNKAIFRTGVNSTRSTGGPNRKAELAAIGADLFGEYGYDTISLADIAGAAGITAPAIYRHFPNKQAILTVAAQDFTATLHALTEQVPRGSGSAEQRLDAEVREIVRLVVSRRRSVRLYLHERRNLERGEHDALVRAGAALLDRVAGLLGTARPDLSPHDRELLTRAALSAVTSLATHRTQASGTTTEGTLRSLSEMVLTADLPHGGRAAGPEPARCDPDGVWFASRRQRLLASALGVFREHGFHGASMEQLGRAAGIGASSVYRHFTSKSDLLAAVYYRAADRLFETASTATAGAESARAALERLTHSYVEIAFANPDLVAVYLSEYGNLPHSDRHALRKVQREHVDMWVRIVTACRGTSQPKSSRLAVHAALNIVHDLALAGPGFAHPAQVEHLLHRVLVW